MIGLAAFISEHRKAIESDLLRETGYELNDVGRTLSWDALDSFLNNLRPDSAIVREIEPELSTWTTQAKTNSLLADIYDWLANINSNLVALAEGKKAKRPKPYPRPGQENKEKTEYHFGSKKDAMPVGKLREWIENRRRNDPRNQKKEVK